MLTVITVENELGTKIYRVYEDEYLTKIQELLEKYCFTDEENEE